MDGARVRRFALAVALITAGLIGVVANVGGGAGQAAAAASAQEPCFGAAARDPLQPCSNPGLRLSVKPTPDDALLLPNSPCVPFEAPGLLKPCQFGVDREGAREDIALVGDSHATHWRGALEHAAQQRGSLGTSISRAGCPLIAVTVVLEGQARADCRTWNTEVVQWFQQHPDVHTVFVSQRATVPVTVPRGERQFERRITGYLRAWASLPASVTSIVVIRDTPVRPGTVLRCVERAIRAKRPAGTVCAVPRPRVLAPDAAATAARRLGSPRVSVIDLTGHMCSERLCFPVVGGVLVPKDESHVTNTFAQTLGPYLLRRLDQLVPRPPGPAM